MPQKDAFSDAPWINHIPRGYGRTVVGKPCWNDWESSNELSQHLAALCGGEQLYWIKQGEQIELNLKELPGQEMEVSWDHMIYITDLYGLPTTWGQGVRRKKRQ